MLHFVFPFLVIATPAPVLARKDISLTYKGFSLSYNCAERTADRWTYKLKYDQGIASRPKSFYMDENLPSNCGQQFTTASYGSGYDRGKFFYYLLLGHLVTSNHMDADDITIRESHYMTNVVPQISSFNQGIWQTTEAITDCYRDLNPITVYGGVVYTDSSNDFFLSSHGIKTPDFMWKVLLTRDASGKDKIISWYLPNQEGLEPLDSYLVSVNDIEEQLIDGLGAIPVPDKLKSFKATSSWDIPSDCDRS